MCLEKVATMEESLIIAKHDAFYWLIISYNLTR